jgi:molybdopterin synthase sulfur carrier subunit
MKVRVKFFAAFKELFGYDAREVELEKGARIQDLLNLICDSSLARQSVFDPSGEIRRDVKILKKGSRVRFANGGQTKLREGDVIIIFPPLLGG